MVSFTQKAEKDQYQEDLEEKASLSSYSTERETAISLAVCIVESFYVRNN